MTIHQPHVRERLREETREVHRRTERLPFFHALREGGLTLDAYRGYLVALRVVLRSALESIAGSPDPRLSNIAGDDGFRLHLLQRDLDVLERRRPQGDVPGGWQPFPRAVVRAHLLAQRVRSRGRTSPHSLLGTAYVLHGSAMGAPILGGWATRTFGLEGRPGTSYLSDGDVPDRSAWKRFLERLQSMQISESELEEVVDAAVETFEGFGSVVEALHPEPEDIRIAPLHDLNPTAGDHPITVDPLELEAALLAGEDTWARFPYYERRYGARGAAFTRSDSAWLVTLARAERDAAMANILWLGRLLAIRGMPRWLMEGHLHRLRQRLIEGTPAPPEQWDNLRLAGEALAEMRTAHVSDSELEKVARAFDRSVGPELASELPETGAIISAAVADDADGIRGTTRSVQEWLTHRRRFPERWRRAVHEAVAAARAVVTRSS